MPQLCTRFAPVMLAVALATGCAGVDDSPDEVRAEVRRHHSGGHHGDGCDGDYMGDNWDEALCIGEGGHQTPTFQLATLQNILGGLVPYFSANPQLLFTGNWTNWYLDPMETALAKLAVMRGILNKYNLYDSYLGPLPTADCPADAATVRQIDGICNDLANPRMGAVGVRFGRNIPPLLRAPDGTVVKNPAAQVNPATLLSPNPREVSNTLLRRRGRMNEVPFLNMLAGAWVQFQVHDWFSHGQNRTDSIIRVPLPADDDLRRRGRTELLVPASAADPSRSPVDNAMLPPTYPNAVTHWWDGSQLYGSDHETAIRLRAFEGGRLKVNGRGLLPKAADGFEDTGMRDNWWLGLGLLHNLFASEHNAIAAMLAGNHPDWDDQQLYDTARMINAALIAKIHTLEWTPAILPSKTLDMGMRANWHGLNRYLETPLPVPPRQYRDPQSGPVLFGIVGGNRDLNGVNFTLTEEFVSVYRMHPLLPESIGVFSSITGRKLADYRTEDTRKEGARRIEERHSMRDLYYSFGITHPGSLTLGNYPRFLQNLELPMIGPFDMGTVDVLRDRERGIPRYNEFRRQLRLKPLASLEELTQDADLLRRLRRVYGEDAAAIERVDLLVGTLAEAERPTCHGFGETLQQVFLLMASRRLQADRFYTSSYTPEVYTQEGLDWVEQSSMKTVLLRHYPALAGTGLSSVDNAFFPWE